MSRLFSVLAVTSAAMVLMAALGATLVAKTVVNQSKTQAASASVRGIALTLSEQISLLSSMLEKMAQDPELTNAITQKKSELLKHAEQKLEIGYPTIQAIKILLAENNDSSHLTKTEMSFADLEMARKTFVVNQPIAIHSDNSSDRHLAIARRIVHNNLILAVIVADINYEFVDRTLVAAGSEETYIELRQGKLKLASVGESNDHELSDFVEVPNTDWKLYYENNHSTSIGESVLLLAVVFIPLLVVMLSFFMVYRKLSDLLTHDMAWVTKAFKDILAEKPLENYPIKLNEIRSVVTTLAQFKRVVKENWLEI